MNTLFVVYYFVLGWLAIGLIGYFVDRLFKITSREAIRLSKKDGYHESQVSESVLEAAQNYNSSFYLMSVLCGPIYTGTILWAICAMLFHLIRLFIPYGFSIGIFRSPRKWFGWDFRTNLDVNVETNELHAFGCTIEITFILSFTLSFAWVYSPPLKNIEFVKSTVDKSKENTESESAQAE